MRDLIQILDAFDAMCAEDSSAALATVVAVEGSSYRRPGARMLIRGDGRTVGGISGGCLEADVIRRARGVIETQRPVVCRYETDGDDHAEPDLQTDGDPAHSLGCGGAVEVLIQPISTANPGPLGALRAVVRDRQSLCMATAYRAGGSIEVPIAARLLAAPDGSASESEITDPKLRDLLLQDMHAEPTTGARSVRHVLPGGWVDVLIEHLRPPQQLVIFGDGPDVEPLLEIAKSLAWHVTIVGWRPQSALRARFAAANRVLSVSAAEPPAAADIDPDAAAVVMTHNLRRDAAVLRKLLDRPPRYVGVLGPRHRTQRLLAAIHHPPDDDAARRLFAPVGLDLGADTPEQIALAILAEIQSALAGRAGGPLRNRPGSIHTRAIPARILDAAPAHPCPA